MDIEEILGRCFELHGVDGAWCCRRCGSLVPHDRRELHLEFHHPDQRTPVMLAGLIDGYTTHLAPWKHGIPPDWGQA